MKKTFIMILSLSIFLLLAGCKTPSVDEILGVGTSTTHNEVRFEHTTNKKKIKTVSNVFHTKKWIANTEFDPIGKDPDVVFLITNAEEGSPLLYVSIYYNDHGADVVNMRGEYTSLSKQEADILKKITI
ncbi:hypothetical protein H9I32_24215 [Bacillus sp. Xin]|uniref:hypothetical protein n=1 Tax=unclassified Bacillus (in: firmicutes) TaxID=185979 RepID=UPI0015735ECA|nr:MULTISPECIES: hypothetical protein [unclassified Bacillus (in: firmicutes)]MBC6975357.1 hypothetical protein [Bacillus sp. Xin]NSW37600.1 hypothetical protein [Bacillus sp. Xin1]